MREMWENLSKIRMDTKSDDDERISKQALLLGLSFEL